MAISAARLTLIVLILAAAVLTAIVAAPFWSALFLGAVLAGALKPWMEALSRRLGGRRNLTAGMLTASVLVALVLPVAGLAAVVVAQVASGVAFVREVIRSEGVWGLIERLPGPVQEVARRAIAESGSAGQIQDLATSQGGTAASAVGGVLSATGSAVLQTVMMLIACYFLLVDGHRLVGWLQDVLPMRRGQVQELLEEFRRTTRAALVSTVATAAIQAVVAFVGYLVTRAPQPFFFCLVTFFFALIPAVGAGSVVIGVAAIQLFTGHAVAAAVLAAWGLVAVGLVDNVAKPFLMKGGMELHGAVVFFALLGGLAVFGMIGLIVGPLIVSFLVTAIRMYQRDYGNPAKAVPGSHAEGVAPEPTTRPAGGDGPHPVPSAEVGERAPPH